MYFLIYHQGGQKFHYHDEALKKLRKNFINNEIDIIITCGSQARQSWCIFVIFLAQFTNNTVTYLTIRYQVYFSVANRPSYALKVK